MPQDDRDVLGTLKSELSYVQNGGYASSPRDTSRVALLFEDSPSCLNFHVHDNRDSCLDCFLIQFVPSDKRGEKVPCRHIPLAPGGQTLLDLYKGGTQTEMEDALAGWLGGVIAQLEVAEQRSEPSNQTVPREKASA